MRIDEDLMEAAVAGLEMWKARTARVEQAIAAASKRPGGRKVLELVVDGQPPAKRKKKRHISAEGRARIAAAQKKRWAAKKKQAS